MKSLRVGIIKIKFRCEGKLRMSGQEKVSGEPKTVNFVHAGLMSSLIRNMNIKSGKTLCPSLLGAKVKLYFPIIAMTG
jgi:hypothetical protein